MDKLLEKIKSADFSKILVNKGYAYFTNGKYNLNIIGVRRAGNKVTNQFDDYIVVEYIDMYGIKTREVFAATTDPGLSSITNPISSKGCAILVPGQYRSSWMIGYHKGKYEALVQCKPLKVYRDNDKDNVYDLNPKTIEEGIYGINLHHAGTDSISVDKWSAGCQVIARLRDFQQLMKTCMKQNGNTFTYTLLREEDL